MNENYRNILVLTFSFIRSNQSANLLYYREFKEFILIYRVDYLSLYIGELIQDAEEKGFYNCPKQTKTQEGYIHEFEQWIEECGLNILKCKLCGKTFELD